MIPYIYSYAHVAQATGLPMARPMFLEDQTNATAWQNDLQYLWGHEMLVAPNAADGGNAVSVWLPTGTWYYFWDDKKYTGGTTTSITAATGVVPAFVRAGAIIPMAPFAKSTFFAVVTFTPYFGICAATAAASAMQQTHVAANLRIIVLIDKSVSGRHAT